MGPAGRAEPDPAPIPWRTSEGGRQMRSLMAALALGVVLATPAVAQQSVRVPPAANTPGKTLSPVISQWQSYRPNLTGQNPLKSAAVASDRDLTSEKIAIAVVLVILAVVIIRSVK